MCQVLTQRTGDWLSHRTRPRTIALSALLLSMASAVGVSFQLHGIGLKNVVLQIVLGSVAGYAIYLLILGLWMRSFSAIDATALLNEGSRPVRTGRPGDTDFDKQLEWSAELAIGHAARDAHSLIAFTLLLNTLGLLFIGIHFIYHAPWYLGQLLVNGGKIRHRAAPKERAAAFLFLPFCQSWPVAVVAIIHSASVGLVCTWVASHAVPR